MAVSKLIHAASVDGVTSGFKNKIINGNFDIWQRGTNFTIANGTAWGCADRWGVGITADGGTVNNLSGTRQEFTVGQTEVPGNPQYYLSWAAHSISAGANAIGFLQQAIEGVYTFAGKKCTVSFWAKGTVAGEIKVSFLRTYGSPNGSPMDGVAGQSIQLTTSWKKYSLTFDIPSVSGKTFTSYNLTALWLMFWTQVGSNAASTTHFVGGNAFGYSGTVNLSQVQVEEGEIATDFEQRHIVQELQLCRRYFEKSYDIDVAPGTPTIYGIHSMYQYNGGGANLTVNSVKFTVPKRITPSVTSYDGLGNNGWHSQYYNNTWHHKYGTATVQYIGTEGFLGPYVGSRYSVFMHWIADAEF